MEIGEVIGLLGGWSILVVAISSWISRLLAERVLSEWRREEQQGLERLRSEFAANRLVLEAGTRSHASGQDLSQEKRLASVERLWASVVQLRERLGTAAFFFSILLPSEYDAAFTGTGALAASAGELSEATILSAGEATRELEDDRPYLGETLWLQFFVYRAFLSRLTSLIVNGRKQNHVSDWREDAGARQLLSYVLPEEDVRAQLQAKQDPRALNRALNSLEALMLKEISLITSGQRSASESFENAKTMRAALANEGQARGR